MDAEGGVTAARKETVGVEVHGRSVVSGQEAPSGSPQTRDVPPLGLRLRGIDIGLFVPPFSPVILSGLV